MTKVSFISSIPTLNLCLAHRTKAELFLLAFIFLVCLRQGLAMTLGWPEILDPLARGVPRTKITGSTTTPIPEKFLNPKEFEESLTELTMY